MSGGSDWGNGFQGGGESRTIWEEYRGDEGSGNVVSLISSLVME